MDCIKLYFKDSLIGVLTYDSKHNKYIFVKNKFFTNKYIESLMGINDENEVYFSNDLFSFFNTFIVRYGDKSSKNDYEELMKIASLDFDKNQFWIGA